MAEYLYQDMLIENGDVVLDAGRNPVLIQDRAVIAQDIKHAIIESNLAVELIAERSPSKKADIRTKLELLVEEDVRRNKWPMGRVVEATPSDDGLVRQVGVKASESDFILSRPVSKVILLLKCPLTE